MPALSPSTAPDAPPDAFRGTWRTDAIARELYAEGAGIARLLPAAVAVPRDGEDVAALVALAASDGLSLVPRGSGSGMAAGALGPGVVVDFGQADVVGPVDRDRQRVVVGPGALRNGVEAAAREVGLTFPVDPSSGAFCTIGGMVGTNAAGAHSLHYGAMRRWVHGLACVFADGTRAWVRRGEPAPELPVVAELLGVLDRSRLVTPDGQLHHEGVRKESSGYAALAARDALAREAPGDALIDLLVGSEGTLACFTAVELALAAAPGGTATLMAAFRSLDHATAAAVGAREAGAVACELLDRTYLDVAEQEGGNLVPALTEAVLIVEVEGENDAAARDAAVLLARAFTRGGAIEVTTATHPATERALWRMRHAASPVLAGLAPKLRSMQFVEDGCVPPERLGDYVRGVRETLAAADTLGVVFGHAGDGHVHVNPLLDVTRPDWRDTVRGLFDRIADLTARLGGTLAGEHGDGRLRAPFLERTWSPAAITTFRALKTAADPDGRLNPGAKLAGAGADPFTDLRVDPALPPLDPRVRAALDAVERDRAWQRHRLALVPAA